MPSSILFDKLFILSTLSWKSCHWQDSIASSHGLITEILQGNKNNYSTISSLHINYYSKSTFSLDAYLSVVVAVVVVLCTNTNNIVLTWWYRFFMSFVFLMNSWSWNLLSTLPMGISWTRLNSSLYSSNVSFILARDRCSLMGVELQNPIYTSSLISENWICNEGQFSF